MTRKRNGSSTPPGKKSSQKTALALLKEENADLKAHLKEMGETLCAIKTGEVDALFMDGRVYSLHGAETPYRILVESMNEGAATLSPEGTLLYCNKRLSALLDIPLKTLIGSQLRRYVRTPEQPTFDVLLANGKSGLSKGECIFETRKGEAKTIQCSFSPFVTGGTPALCLVATDMTDRKQLENARSASMLASIGDAVVATNLHGTIEFMNAVAENLTGWTLAEASMKPASDVIAVISEQTRAPLESPIRQVLETGKPARLAGHVLLIRKDGSEIPIDDSAAPILGQNGKMMGVVLVFRDITERNKTEEELHRSNRRINEILSSIQDDFYVLNRDWIFVFASQRFTSRIGKEPKDFVGNNIWEMFPNQVGTDFEQNLRAAMERREIRRFEVGGKDTSAWYRMAVFPSPEGITVLGTDITERRHMEEELVRSESEYRLLFEFNPQPMWMVDKKTLRFLAVNEAALAQYGYTKEEFLSMRLFDVIHADHHAEILRWDARPSGSMTRPVVQTHIRKNESMIKVEVIARDTKFEGESVRLMQGQDVTHRLQAEEALRENLQLFQAFVESSREASLMVDERGMILAASQPGISMLACSRDDLIGQNVLRYIPSEQLPILEKSYDTLLKEPLRPRIAMVRIRLLDGTSIWVEAVCSMLRVDDRIGGFIVVLKRIEVGVMERV